MKDQVIEEIKQQCGKMRVLNNGWVHFVYRHLHYLYILDDANGLIRLSIPHVINSKDYTYDVLNKAVNETNREVKFIKVLVLNNGSVSLNYDHRISDNETLAKIVLHMIVTLLFASEHLINKLRQYETNRSNTYAGNW